jgi:hypothetical protein
MRDGTPDPYRVRVRAWSCAATPERARGLTTPRGYVRQMLRRAWVRTAHWARGAADETAGAPAVKAIGVPRCRGIAAARSSTPDAPGRAGSVSRLGDIGVAGSSTAQRHSPVARTHGQDSSAVA